MTETWQTIEQAAVTLGLSVRTINRHMVAGKLQSRLTDGRREVLVHIPTPEPVTAQPTPAVEPTVNSAQPSNGFSFDANVSDAASAVTDIPASQDAGSTSAHVSPFSQAPSPPVSVDPETVLALADNAAQKAELAVNAYQTLARYADTEVRQMRRSARFAWSTVMLMTLGVCVAIGWTTHRITRASDEQQRLQTQVMSSAEEVRRVSFDLSHERLTSGETQKQLRQEREASEKAMRAEYATSIGSLRTELSDKIQKLSVEKAESEKELQTELTTARQDAARAEGQLAAYREQAAQARANAEAIPASAKIAADQPSMSSNTANGSSLSASDTSVIRPTTQASSGRPVESRQASATSRPAALRSKVLRTPTTRPAPVSETSSVPTSDERPLR